MSKSMKELYYEAKKNGELEDESEVSHLGCPSYPNCDIASEGCCVASLDEVEYYGYRD